MTSNEETSPSAAQELGTLLFLVSIVAPLLAVAFVAAYGFIVWFYQVFAGPPTG